MNQTKKLQILSISVLVVALGWYGVIQDWPLMSSNAVRTALFGCTIALVLFLADAAYSRLFKQAEPKPHVTPLRLATDPIPCFFITIVAVAYLWPSNVLQQFMHDLYVKPGSGVRYLMISDTSLGNCIIAILVLLLAFCAQNLIRKLHTARDRSRQNPQSGISPYNPLLSPAANAIAIVITALVLLTYLTSYTWVTDKGIGSRIAWSKSFHKWKSVEMIEEIHMPSRSGRGYYSCDMFHFQITFSDHSTWTSRDITFDSLPADKTYNAICYVSERSGVDIEPVSRYPRKHPSLPPEL